MKIDILTLFPAMFDGALKESMIKIAQKKKKVKIKVHNLRKWTYDRHRTADDKPYGGGAGMVIKVEPVYKALEAILGKSVLTGIIKKKAKNKGRKVVLLTPKGKKFDQKSAKDLSKLKNIVLICGHYEGVDHRVHALVTDEISIGDYIVTGGEIPAMVVIDAVTRLIPGVLGDKMSLKDESFENGLLEYPQYTRPREFKGMGVPGVLLSGDHDKITEWRRKESLKKTRAERSDLLNETTAYGGRSGRRKL